MEDRQHEPEVDGDRGLSGEKRLDPLHDREVELIDLVVNGVGYKLEPVCK